MFIFILSCTCLSYPMFDRLSYPVRHTILCLTDYCPIIYLTDCSDLCLTDCSMSDRGSRWTTDLATSTLTPPPSWPT